MARPVVATIAYAIAFWLIYLTLVTTTPGQEIENRALRASELRLEATRATSLDVLSISSVGTMVAAMVAILLIAWARRRPGLGILAAGMIGAAVVTAEVLKEILPRPALLDGPAWLLRNSFPSGTTTLAAAVGIALLLVVPERTRWVALVASTVLVVIVGQATQVTGWHRASDVIGAVLLSAAFGGAAVVVLAGIGHTRPSLVGGIDRRFLLVIVGLAALAAALALALQLALLAFPILRAPVGSDGAFLHTSADLLVFASTTVILASFAWVIGPFSLGARPEPSAATALRDDGSGDDDVAIDPTAAA